MNQYNIEKLYPGHFFGSNLETITRVNDLHTICNDALDGKIKGEENPRAMLGLNLVINYKGVRVNYNEKSLEIEHLIIRLGSSLY